LKDSETQAIPQRIEALKREVEEQHKQESHLQTTFANLIAKKSEFLEILAAQHKDTTASHLSQQTHQLKQPQESIMMDTDVMEGEAPAKQPIV